jgi:MFS family permease
MRKALPATILLLGLVSFLNDLASDMIYPLLPLFLAGVLGAGPLALGLIEGVAEATASLLKVASGLRSDATRRRVPLILAGYGASCAVRPLMGLAGGWTQVLALRFADRVGKGLRTSPRDALIADVTTPEQRGRAYGVQRALDHAGAVAGPLLAAALLSWWGWGLRAIFLLTAVPAALVLLVLLLGLREPPRAPAAAPSPAAPRAGWAQLGGGYRRFLLALGVFSLGGSTDAFLILRLGQLGISAAEVSLLWAAFHVVKMTSAYGGGWLTDRWGARRSLTLGWLLYAAVYAAFAWVQAPGPLVAIFLVYGLFYGLTEAAGPAWVSLLVPPPLRGTAFGYFHGAVGLAALPASAGFGLLLAWAGAPAAFLSGALLAAGATLLLVTVPRGT